MWAMTHREKKGVCRTFGIQTIKTNFNLMVNQERIRLNIQLS